LPSAGQRIEGKACTNTATLASGTLARANAARTLGGKVAGAAVGVALGVTVGALPGTAGDSVGCTLGVSARAAEGRSCTTDGAEATG